MIPKHQTRGGMLGGILGGFGGGIFGSSAWIIVNCANTKDWTAMSVVIIFAITLFIVCVKICIAKPTRSWIVAQWMVAALGVLNLAFVNIRWEKLNENHLTSPGETLMKTNLILGAVFGGIIVLFFFLSKICNKYLVEYELQQMQIKDL